MEYKTASGNIVFPARIQTRPLTLREVLLLRDGVEIPRHRVSGYPVILVRSRINRDEWVALSLN